MVFFTFGKSFLLLQINDRIFSLPEGIAGDGQNVQKVAKLGHPLLSDLLGNRTRLNTGIFRNSLLSYL